MREFSLNIDEALINGISPDERVRRNGKFLQEARNVKVTEFGMKEFEPITDPFGGLVSEDFPFPQLFQTPMQTLLATRNSIYDVDTSIVPWQREQLSTVGMNGANKQIVPGGPWQFVDTLDGWMLFNGECIVFKDVHQRLEFKKVVNRVVDSVYIQSACHHRGRIMIGGFDPDKFWGREWDKFFRLYEEQISEPLPLSFNDMEQNYVVWSSIGGGDFPLWLFKPEAAVYSNITEHSDDYGYSYEGIDTTMMIDNLRRNEFGFMPMPWKGEVIGLAPILDKVVVLGTEGVSGLVLANTEMAASYGLRNLVRTGVAGRSAFHASDRRVLFIDSEGSLWQVTGELVPQRLGYRQELSQMLGTDIVVTWNEEDDEYFISNGERSYQFTQSGLTSVYQSPTSVMFYQGGNVGLYKEVENKNALIVSQQFDLGIRGLKTVNSINLGVRGRGTISVAVDYRYNSDDEFKRTRFVEVNKEGDVFLRITCLDFRIVIMHDVTGAVGDESFELDYVTVRWQASDKRQIRGPNANTNVA